MGKFQSLGTAFQIVIDEGELYFSYLVTAKHVVDESKRGGYPHLTARVNKINGGAELVDLPDGWITWTNTAIDVAVLAFPADFNTFDLKAMPPTMLADDAVISRN